MRKAAEGKNVRAAVFCEGECEGRKKEGRKEGRKERDGWLERGCSAERREEEEEGGRQRSRRHRHRPFPRLCAAQAASFCSLREPVPAPSFPDVGAGGALLLVFLSQQGSLVLAVCAERGTRSLPCSRALSLRFLQILEIWTEAFSAAARVRERRLAARACCMGDERRRSRPL